jgi:integrase
MGKRTFGSITKLPSGRYRARYVGPDLQRHNAPETFTARMDAEAWLAAERKLTEDAENWRSPRERLAAVRATREAERKRTFSVYAEDWLEHRPLSPSTRYKYRRLLDRHLLPAFGDKPLTSITRADVTTWYRKTLIGKPTARKHVYDLLAVIMRTAEDDELIARTPVRIKGASTIERAGSTEPATADELAVILRHTPERFRLMILLSVWCALRPAEVRVLRRSDVDTKGNLLKIRRAWDRTPGALDVKSPKTRAGVRNVHIPEDLMPAVREHLLAYAQPGKDGLLFPSARGQVIGDAAVADWYYPAREAAGRRDLRLHDLRHTGGTWAGQGGATIAELMARLGHKTPAAAMRYQHAAAERDREIARRLPPVPLVTKGET